MYKYNLEHKMNCRQIEQENDIAERENDLLFNTQKQTYSLVQKQTNLILSQEYYNRKTCLQRKYIFHMASIYNQRHTIQTTYMAHILILLANS